MTNLIIASFTQEAEAIEASHKLNELDSIGDITIYEMVIIKKNANGETHILKADTTDGLTTLSGMAIGTLVGALAGPVGMVVGMFTGTLTGAAMEADDYGFAADFISKESEQLQPGMVAVIAEVQEDNPIFIDGSINPLGGTLTRSTVDYEYTKYSDEEIEELDEEIADVRAEIKSANEEEKARIKQKIARLKEKRKERIAEFKGEVKDAANDIKTSVNERKIARIRSRMEKHQMKIANLEKRLQAILEKGKETLKAVES